MSLKQIIKLTNAIPSGLFGSFVGHCPAHNDKKKSLSFSEEDDGKILVYCHAGCSQEAVIDSLTFRGAWNTSKQDDLFLKQLEAEFLWGNSEKITSSDLAAKYLTLRGIKLVDYPESLRFQSKCYNSELKKETPALFAKIQNSNNELIGIQRTYLNENGGKLSVESPRKISGSCSKGYVELKADFAFEFNQDSGVLHLTEGIETGLAIFSSFRETTYCVLSAGNLSKIQTDKTVKTIHIWGDKDSSGTGQKEAEKAAKVFSSNNIKVILHLPKDEIPVGSKGIDFLDVFIKNPNEIIEEKNNGRTFKNEILPIKILSYNLPKPDDRYYPSIIRDWVFAQAARLNVAAESVTVPVFTIIGSLLGAKLAIRPKKFDDWLVHPNLWGLNIAPPGTKKTAILNTSLNVLTKIEQRENQKAQEKVQLSSGELYEINIRTVDLKKKLDQAILQDNQIDKKNYMKELDQLEKRKIELGVVLKRYVANSFTLEKLIDILGENPNGLLICRDEINGLLETLKKKGSEAMRPFLLEAWNGDGSFFYETVTRPTKPLDGICLGILGGTQPSIINKMLTEMRRDQNDDGFLQRFQMIAFPEQNLTPEFVDKGLDPDLQNKYYHLIETICNLDTARFGEKQLDIEKYITKLHDNSYNCFIDYMNGNELEISQAENNGYRNYLGKVGKLLPGLILIFHVLDNIESNKSDHKASIEVVKMSILWCELFKAHARKLYDTEYNFESDSGIELAKKIKEGKIVDGSSLRSLHRNGWAHLKSSQEAELAVQFLEKHNWLKIVEEKPMTGRPSTTIKFHSNLLEFLSKEKWRQ